MSTARLLQMSGAVVDLVYRVDAVPSPGEEAVAQESMIAPGGGFNAMVAASRAGMQVSYGGSHGTGRFADMVRSALSELEIPVLQRQLENCDQGTCVVLVDRQGERTFISQAGAERYFGSAQFGHMDTAAFEFVLISGYTFADCRNPGILDEWLKAFPSRPKLVFDPSPVVDKVPPAILSKLMARCAWISASAEEARTITGKSDTEHSATALVELMEERAMGAVVRNGAHGCWLALRDSRGRGLGGRGLEATDSGAVFVSPYAVDAVDTNGAGDTHIGSFIAALAAGDSPIAAARFANAAAALSTLECGPATAPLRQRTLAFMARNPHAPGNDAGIQTEDPNILQPSNI